MQPNLKQINSGASGGIFGGLEGTIAVKCNIQFEYLDVNGVEEIVAISIDNGDFQPFYHGSVITIQENSSNQIIGYTLDGVEHTVTPGGGTGSVAKLTDIGNVSITSAEAGQVVTWSGTEWINKSVGEGSVAKLGDIGNVTIGSDIATGQTISWTGTNWVNANASSGTFAGLSDTDFGNNGTSGFDLETGDIAVYVGGTSQKWFNLPAAGYLDYQIPGPIKLATEGTIIGEGGTFFDEESATLVSWIQYSFPLSTGTTANYYRLIYSDGTQRVSKTLPTAKETTQ